MATNYNYPDPTNIEKAAEYRTGVAGRLFNVLTGGLGGAITGTTERAQEAARARQALLQEEFQKRDEQRALERQLMINALQSGVETPVGQTLEEKMADLRQKRLRSQLAAGEGARYVYGDFVGPSQYQGDVAFQLGASSAQQELDKMAAELRQREKLAAPELAQQLTGMGGTARPGATAGELRGEILRRQYQLPWEMRLRGEVDALTDMYANNPNLKAFKGYTPETIGSVAPVLAKTMIALGKKELEETADAKNKELAASATKEFSSILQLPPDERTKPENVARLNELSRYVPPIYTQNEKFLGAVGLGKPLDDNQLAQIKSYDDSLRGINRFISVLSEVAKTPGSIKKFQSSNFGTIANELRNVKSKFFTNDAERELASQLVQEYEGFVSGERKSLFGQSLTLGESRKSDINFGTAADKNFFNRALQFIDRTVESDPVTFYLNSGKSVPEGTIKSITDKKRKFDEFKSNPDVSPFFGVFGQGAGITPKTSRIQALQNEAAQLRQALGMTNVPSIKR